MFTLVEFLVRIEKESAFLSDRFSCHFSLDLLVEWDFDVHRLAKFFSND